MAADSDNQYLKSFYQALRDQPLAPDAPQYVELYNNPELAPADPIQALATTIEWSPLESKQLFSGFRGTGKSTELRRLKQLLQSQVNTKVVLCDMERYLNLTTPVDISDFLVSVAGALSDELEGDPDLLGKDPSHEGYWTRFRNFLTRTRVELPELDVGLQVNLKTDPTFRQRLQEHLRGHLSALVGDVRGFVEDCVKALQERHGDDVRVVVLLDSIERIRGTAINAGEVAASLETVFEGHADKLGLPYMHVIYTVPPWLKIKAPGVAGLYDGSQQIPCVKVRDIHGQPCQAGLDTLADLIGRRGDWQRLVGSREALDDLCLASGGYLRDLFRLLQTLLLLSAGRSLPAERERIELAKHEIRNSYLPIANQDARWLERIERTHHTQLEETSLLHQLSRYFDTHLILAYRNGEEWWSVHPLLAEHVRRQVAAMDEQDSSGQDT